MVSKSADSSKSRKSHGEQASGDLGVLASKINQLKKQIQAERATLIREKIENNRKKLETHVSQILSLSMSRIGDASADNNGSGKMLSSRIMSPTCVLNGPTRGSGDKDNSSSQEVAISMSAKLPLAMKIPPYTTWIFLDRNQRMAEDQSVVGRRRIYYDKHGSEALICSDSEEEPAEPQEEKHEFSEAESRIIQMVSQDYEPTEEVLRTLTQFIGGTTSEIHEAYTKAKKKDQEKANQNVSVSEEVEHDGSILLEKSLGASLDSLDNLFCRRCLVFDCRLHGYSQTIIMPSERQYYPLESQEVTPCSDQCYLQLKAEKKNPETLEILTGSRTSEEYLYEISFSGDDTGKSKVPKQITTMLDEVEGSTEDSQEACNKKKKMPATSDTVPLANEDSHAPQDQNDKSRNPEGCTPNKHESQMTTNREAVSSDDAFRPSICLSADVMEDDGKGETKLSTKSPLLNHASNSVGIQSEASSSNGQWRPLEKELYLKGLEIFGRNSCLIARNLLSGLKTCTEVFSYMHNSGEAMGQKLLTACSMSDGNGTAGADHKEQEVPSRARLLRRRGRTRRLKYSWKSAGHPSMWRRIADGKNQSCKQYIPCECKSMCGKQCPCVDNATCCEKYCGCSKSCKNRFRGCHCAKSQCRSRQCPCFAAGRECDPDVCRNCWVSCGDGSLDLGEPPRRGEGQCGNMRLLLRQQQRILLGKSDVAGWGAFLKNPVNKNDYLGEYTGEIISHREADKRGKIYDRANSSFLFDLNDQYVLDAYRKGDKLKFANHSSNPNCYAKVMLVAGDHRVGIFANERIEASEELFYDYHYGPDQKPIWARKTDDSKGDDPSIPQGRAKKHQSHR